MTKEISPALKQRIADREKAAKSAKKPIKGLPDNPAPASRIVHDPSPKSKHVSVYNDSARKIRF